MPDNLDEMIPAVPTHVGVNRPSVRGRQVQVGRPHARGGEPAHEDAEKALEKPSPRTWG